jgi:uncharacterized membrane protein
MASPTPGKTQLGLDANLAGLLCYLPICFVGLVFSIVALIVEKDSRSVKFHAFQSLLLHGVAIILFVALFVTMFLFSLVADFLGVLIWIVMVLTGLALFGLAVLMMIKAFNNEEFPLPVIGELAGKWSRQ